MARARLIRLLAAWIIAAAALCSAAHAHQSPSSEAYIDFHDNRVEIAFVIPAAEYSFASGNTAASDRQARDLAERYLRGNITARTTSAGVWQTRIDRLAFVDGDGGRDLVGTLSLIPPSAAGLGEFTLDWRAVIADVPDHFVLVMLRRDVATKLGDEPVVIGTLRGDRGVLVIDRGAAPGWMPFANAVWLGGGHILGGIDHLAFLLALLLPLPLIARRGTWRQPKPIKPTIRAVAVLISGFTLGHSATLIAASLGGLALPSVLVETLIAVSVLIAAIHAIRPIFPRREALFATLFGLIHGLGFAGFLSETDLSMARNIGTLLGFNIGIELVQLAIAVAIVPALLLIAQTTLYHWLRNGLALFCAVIAIIWVGDRYFGLNAGFIGAFEQSVEVSLIVMFFGILCLGTMLFFLRMVPRRATDWRDRRYQ